MTQSCPSFEQTLADDVITRPLVLDMRVDYGGPAKMKKAGYHRVHTWMSNRARKNPTKRIDVIFTALKAQTVTVLGTAAAELVIVRLAANIKALIEQRKTIAEQVEELWADFPLSEVLMSLPRVGVKSIANILLAIGDCSDFKTAGHLAAYAGIAPVTRRSGTSIRGEFPARSGNKRLKNALF